MIHESVYAVQAWIKFCAWKNRKNRSIKSSLLPNFKANAYVLTYTHTDTNFCSTDIFINTLPALHYNDDATGKREKKKKVKTSSLVRISTLSFFFFFFMPSKQLRVVKKTFFFLAFYLFFLFRVLQFCLVQFS